MLKSKFVQSWPRIIKTLQLPCRSCFSFHLRQAFRRASECHIWSDHMEIYNVWAICLMCIHGTCRSGSGSCWRVCFEIQVAFLSKRTYLADLCFRMIITLPHKITMLIKTEFLYFLKTKPHFFRGGKQSTTCSECVASKQATQPLSSP